MLLAAALATAASALPAVAHAGDADAKALFAEGRKLREVGQCAEAITRFRLALEAWPEGIGALLNAAECEVTLKRYAAARRDYWDLRRAALKTSDPRYADWDKDADEAYRKLDRLVPRLIIDLVAIDASGAPTALPSSDKLSITLDGQPLNPKLVGTELERDVGSVVIDARYGAATGVRRTIELAEGAHERVRIELPVPRETPGEGRHHTEPISPAPSGLSGLDIGAIASFTLAALAGGGALGAFAVRQDALGAVETACPNYRAASCPSSVTADVSRGRTASTLVDVFIGVGAAAALSGVVLVSVSAAGDDGDGAVALELLPDGTRLRATVDF